jgi:hypothetical protein
MSGLLTFLITAPLSFIGGLVVPHLQKPLTDYRAVLGEISYTLLSNAGTILSLQRRDKPAEHSQLAGQIRDLRSRLQASATMISAFVKPILHILGLVAPDSNIQRAADLMTGLANRMELDEKDFRELDIMFHDIGDLLRINVGRRGVVPWRGEPR